MMSASTVSADPPPPPDRERDRPRPPRRRFFFAPPPSLEEDCWVGCAAGVGAGRVSPICGRRTTAAAAALGSVTRPSLGTSGMSTSSDGRRASDDERWAAPPLLRLRPPRDPRRRFLAAPPAPAWVPPSPVLISRLLTDSAHVARPRRAEARHVRARAATGAPPPLCGLWTDYRRGLPETAHMDVLHQPNHRGKGHGVRPSVAHEGQWHARDRGDSEGHADVLERLP